MPQNEKMLTHIEFQPEKTASQVETQVYKADMIPGLIARRQAAERDAEKRKKILSEIEKQALLEQQTAQAQAEREAQEEEKSEPIEFADIAAAVAAIGAAQWAMDNGFLLEAARDGMMCRQMPNILFQKDGSWTDPHTGQSGTGALDFAVQYRGMSTESALVGILEKHNPDLLEWLRTRPPRAVKPDIPLMHPAERIRQIRNEKITEKTDKPALSKEAILRD